MKGSLRARVEQVSRQPKNKGNNQRTGGLRQRRGNSNRRSDSQNESNHVRKGKKSERKKTEQRNYDYDSSRSNSKSGEESNAMRVRNNIQRDQMVEAELLVDHNGRTYLALVDTGTSETLASSGITTNGKK